METKNPWKYYKSSLETAIDFVIVVFTAGVIFAFCLILGCDEAHANKIPEERAVNAIIGEAEGEGSKGQFLIACAIKNRGTLSGVYGEKAPRVVSKKYSKETLQSAKDAWFSANNEEMNAPLSCELIKGADHWGSKQVDGAWIKKMQSKGFIKTFEYKSHVFFRKV